MPKQTFVAKPPVEKLPLATRKEIRDKYENNKEDYEKQVADILGVPFKFSFNPNEVWAYATESTSGAGYVFSGYAEGFIYAVKYFVENYGDDGKEYFKSTVTKSEVTLNANEKGEDAPTIWADVKDGVFRVLFRPSQLGYNSSYLTDAIVPALEGVPKEGFSLRAKDSINKGYNEGIEDCTEAIAEITGIKDVILDPNFEENYQKLSEALKDTDWHQNFGRAIFAYFNDGLKYQLGYQGFKEDDMLQEGLQEALTSKTFKVRVVPKLVKGYYNEPIIEDGVCYLQTTPNNWYVNTSEMGTGLLDLL